MFARAEAAQAAREAAEVIDLEAAEFSSDDKDWEDFLCAHIPPIAARVPLPPIELPGWGRGFLPGRGFARAPARPAVRAYMPPPPAVLARQSIRPPPATPPVSPTIVRGYPVVSRSKLSSR